MAVSSQREKPANAFDNYFRLSVSGSGVGRVVSCRRSHFAMPTSALNGSSELYSRRGSHAQMGSGNCVAAGGFVPGMEFSTARRGNKDSQALDCSSRSMHGINGLILHGRVARWSEISGYPLHASDLRDELFVVGFTLAITYSRFQPFVLHRKPAVPLDPFRLAELVRLSVAR